MTEAPCDKSAKKQETALDRQLRGLQDQNASFKGDAVDGQGRLADQGRLVDQDRHHKRGTSFLHS